MFGMNDDDIKRTQADMDEWTKAVQARWTEESRCESPMCESKKVLKRETKGLHKAVLAIRLKPSPRFQKAVDAHTQGHKDKGEEPCYLDNIVNEQGALTCLCCAIQYQIKLIELGFVPGRDGAMAVTQMVDGEPEDLDKRIERNCAKQAAERLPLMVMGGEAARAKAGMAGDPRVAGMVALEKSELEEIMKREGPEGVKRYIAERVAHDIADKVVADMTKEKALKDGEVGAPISESELKEIRRTLINDVDTLPSNIANLISRSDN